MCIDLLTTVKDVIVILGLPITAASATLAALQFRRTVLWNKLNAPFALFPNTGYCGATTAAAKELARLRINFHDLSRTKPLTGSQVELILADSDAYSAVHTLLNYLEDYAAALHTGVLHRKTALHLMGGAFRRYFSAFKPLIHARRVAVSDKRLWVELELGSLVFTRLLEQKLDEADEKRILELQELTAKELYRAIGEDEEAESAAVSRGA